MEKKYKICAITTIRGTMEWFIADSMKELSKNGYDVTMMCKMEPDFVRENSSYAKCVDIPIYRGVNFVNLIKCIYIMYVLFKKERFDVIYYTSPNASFCAAIAGFFAGVNKRIYNQWGIRYISITGPIRFIFKLVEKITCSFSTHIREASPLNMELAVQEGLCSRDKISVRGIGGTVGVDLKECDSFDRKKVKSNLRNKYSIPDEAFVYGYVGRINKDKGINELIEAFTELDKQHDNLYLVLVGMKDDTNPISEKSQKLVKENNHIILTGNVSPSDVYKHMAVFDVLTHPTYREGFGKVLQEAMGMSLPIITTNIIGPKEVVEADISGLLVTDHNVKELCFAMERLLLNSQLRDMLSKNARIRAERFFDRPIMLNYILEDTNCIMEE